MPDRGPDSDRGVSEVLGYVLVFTLILSSIVTVSVLGISGLEDARGAEQSQNAEKGFDVLHASMAELYTENAPSRATELTLGEQKLYLGDEVTVRVKLFNGSDWNNDTTYQVRPVVQTLETDENLVYEAGAVFRTGTQGGVVFRQPPVFSRDGSVHLTVAAFQSDSTRSLGGSTILVRGQVDEREVLVWDVDGTYETVAFNVTSSRADLWHDHLETEGFSCSDPSDDTTECTRSSFDRLSVTVHEIEVSLLR